MTQSPQDERHSVSGAINRLREQIKKDSDESGSIATEQLRWSKIGAALVFIYTIITFVTLVATTRPAVGVDEVKLEYGVKRQDGLIQFSDSLPSDINGVNTFQVHLIIKNSGNNPAYAMVGYWDSWVDGKQEFLTDQNQVPFLFAPGKAYSLRYIIQPDQYRQMLLGKRELQFLVHISYKGPFYWPYSECIRERFEPTYTSFANMGESC